MDNYSVRRTRIVSDIVSLLDTRTADMLVHIRLLKCTPWKHLMNWICTITNKEIAKIILYIITEARMSCQS